MVGGWKVDLMCLCDGKMPQKLASGFTQAFEGHVGASFKPVLYCGSQLVNGLNHMFICEETLVTNPPAKHVARVVLHESLEGKFNILFIEQII